ncbi:MAG: DUF120 domain-containing protein [Nitrososphaerota archaeon]|nr:CTP-dependent riboflavin kinase [Candidatus Bathyarchaeota archaeon]MDW8023605.1 DUF120 domain-containing protein [Nitrososphaerota archaeon]
MKKPIFIRGKIFSGAGEGTKFTTLPWVKRQIEEKLGFPPYPGTLNIRLLEDNASLRKLLARIKGVEILPVEGYCLGKCFKALLMKKVKCAIILPDVKGYPEDVIEIVAPVNLREKLKLKDGDIVEVTVTV